MIIYILYLFSFLINEVYILSSNFSILLLGLLYKTEKIEKFDNYYNNVFFYISIEN